MNTREIIQHAAFALGFWRVQEINDLDWGRPSEHSAGAVCVAKSTLKLLLRGARRQSKIEAGRIIRSAVTQYRRRKPSLAEVS